MQRICHITTVHSRIDTRIKLKECESLVASGFEVHLVVADGLGDSVCENIQIHDIGPKPRSRIKRMLVQPKRALKRVLALEPGIVHLHDPELLPIGVSLSQIGIRVIYDAHEDVPRQHLNRHYIPGLIRPAISSLFELYENRAVSKLAGVVGATPYITQRFVDQGLRAVNVNNYPLPAELAPNGGNVSRQKRICYVGTISRKRGFPQAIRALSLVSEARMTLCGNFSPASLEAELKAELGWAQVDYLGHVDRTTARHIMAESSAGIVTFLPAPNHMNAQPNKLFEYMSAELPVIASDFPLWREIVEGNGCGVCVDPESHHKIADSIRMLLDSPREAKQMGQKGRQAVLRKYNWPVEAQKLIDFYMDMK